MLLIGIIAIAFAGLARMYGKKPWVYALIGMGTAIGAQLMTGAVYGILYQPTAEELAAVEIPLSLMAAGISIVTTILVYTILRRKAERAQRALEEEQAGSQIFGQHDLQ